MVFHFGKLVAVHRSSVEIEQNAVKYTLEIAYDKFSTSTRPHKARGGGRSESSFVKKLSDRQYEVNRKSVLQSLEQPEHILTDARLLPNIKDGKQEGFVILEVQPSGLYDNLGLKNNDILLRVNGLVISNPEVAIQAMTALKGMNTIKLDIMRDSEKMSLNYRLR
jgi:type II secretion system protein C